MKFSAIVSATLNKECCIAMDTLQANVIGKGEGKPSKDPDSDLRVAYLNPPSTACYIRVNYGVPCTASSLAKMRVRGTGPPFRLFGKHPVYSPNDIDTWAAAQLGPKVHCTAALNYVLQRDKHRGGRPRGGGAKC